MIYNDKEYKLNSNEEQYANLWARQLMFEEKAKKEKRKATSTKLSSTWDKLFRNNFWNDFRKILTPSHKSKFKKFKDLDFSKIKKTLESRKENITEEQKYEKKMIALDKKLNYGYAYVNGNKEAIGNVEVEPLQIFKGRGNNSNRGKIKKNIFPEEVTINIGREVDIPTPPQNHKWQKVVHDQKARWLAKWKESISGQNKYIYMSKSGQFAAGSDSQKFEKARKLNKYIDVVREGYQKYIKSHSIIKKQIGTVLFFVDHFGFRIGGEKDSVTADTVGATTLKIKNIQLIPPNKIKLNFQGKDDIKYNNILTIPKNIYENIKLFKENRNKDAQLFNLISACDVNVYLKTFDKDFTAKIFRTRLASTLMHNELDNLKIKKNTLDQTKKYMFKHANLEIAKALNHKKATKTGIKALENAQKRLQKAKETLKTVEKKSSRGERLKKQIQKYKQDIEIKKKSTKYSPGTSLDNYIDPRLVVAWCRHNNLEMKDVYTKARREKFKWAENTSDKWDYLETILSPGYGKMKPKTDITCPISHKEDNILDNFQKILKSYGYVLIRQKNHITTHHVSKPDLIDKTTFRQLYNTVNELIQKGYTNFALILIDALCKNVRKYPIKSKDNVFIKKTYDLVQNINI